MPCRFRTLCTPSGRQATGTTLHSPDYGVSQSNRESLDAHGKDNGNTNGD
jgi:hypothetical protein